MSRDTVSETAGICVLRDAADLAPLLCGHYLRAGFARLHFIDDGSTDGTFEFLTRIARKTESVTVCRVVNENFLQAYLLTAAANNLIDDGYRLIFPFDADEFWHLSRQDVRKLAGHRFPRSIFGKMSNFVQSRCISQPGPSSLLSARYRVGENETATIEEVVGFERPWIARSAPKIGFWSQDHVKISVGQHRLDRGPTDTDENWFEVFHIPLRSKSELTKRALNYEPRRAATRKESESWQSKFHRQAVLSGRGDSVWAANSADASGQLDVYGKPMKLVRDDRLRHVISRAAAYTTEFFGEPCLDAEGLHP